MSDEPVVAAAPSSRNDGPSEAAVTRPPLAVEASSTKLGGGGSDHAVMPEAAAAAAAQPTRAATTITTTTGPAGKRRAMLPVIDAVTMASLTQAAALLSGWNYHATASALLQPPSAAAVLKSENSSSGTSPTAGAATEPAVIPSPATVRTVVLKYVMDQPPWVCWNKSDMAPQLKVTDSYRLALQGALRGYRMARANQGVSTGCYYFECVILPGPTPKDILSNLPPNARLGPGLEQQLRAAMNAEANDKTNKAEETQRVKKRKPNDNEAPPTVGGHLRIGWSMRTGDLQAPVGYDKWSYGVRSIVGSIVHKSQRQDTWGGEGFGPGDVLGCAIALFEDDPSQNQIRFFKNGECMGVVVIAKGKREGGEAFVGIDEGVYYPAVSSYMGGAVKANFGPHWVCHPRRLPAGFPKLQPISDLFSVPKSPDDAVNLCAPAMKQFRKPEHQAALKEAIRAEAQVLYEAYESFLKAHVESIRSARTDRGLSVHDLPAQEGPAELETNT